MQTIHLKIKFEIQLDNHRQYAWKQRERAAGRPIYDDFAVDPNGWVLYAIWERVETELDGRGNWHGQYRVLLTDGDKPVCDYPLNDDEWWEFPTMPANWAIPF